MRRTAAALALTATLAAALASPAAAGVKWTPKPPAPAGRTWG